MKRIVTYFSNVFWHLLFFSGPVILIGWICLLAWLIPVFGEMSPENATRRNLTWWFLVRDFQQLPEEKRLPLVECYLKEFGRESGKIPQFEFSDFMQNRIVAVDIARRERVKQELNAAKEPEKLLAIPVPMQERNAMLLAKIWFFDQMRQYELADFNGKKERLSQMVVEIKWWQKFNEDFLFAAGVKPYRVAESLKELEMIFARWEAESSPEDRARIAAFKPRITAALISDGVSEVAGGDVGKTIGSVLSIFSRPKKDDADLNPKAENYQ
ncbi:MAG: hypothetical protein FWH27_13155 [Planctomycetaceae bacterium]|nr:hypothetical protein [Planctomycetaceae bacterium]